MENLHPNFLDTVETEQLVAMMGSAAASLGKRVIDQREHLHSRIGAGQETVIEVVLSPRPGWRLVLHGNDGQRLVLLHRGFDPSPTH